MRLPAHDSPQHTVQAGGARVETADGGLPASGAATVFGLDVHSETPLWVLHGASAAPTGRSLDVSTSTDEISWPKSAELIAAPLDAAGNELFRVEADPERGYLTSAPGHGSHALTPDGRLLRCAPAGCLETTWQRLLISQVLPFAAVLQGLEVFHASAVVMGEDAIAIAGASGAGKTSVALALCRLGGDFLADDVVALEPSDGRLLVHPGTQIAGLDHREAKRLEDAGEPQEEPIVAVNDRERLLAVRGASEPAPLAALFFVDRRMDGPTKPRFEPVTDAQWLLSATFNFVLTSPERLQRLLEVCALVARCRVERIVAGPDASATQLADAVAARMHSPA